jgi:hypothetical protein
MVYITPIYLNLKNFFKKYYLNTLEDDSNEILDFIYNGKEIFHCLKKDFYQNKDLIPEKFDFIIYSKKDEYNEKEEIFLKKIHYYYPINIVDFSIEKTDYSFMLMELNIQNKIFKLNLQSYFLINNKINALFLHYYFNKYLTTLPIAYKDFLENFALKIIDDSVNIKNVYYLDEILFNKSNYLITQIYNKTFENKISNSFTNLTKENS